MGLVILLHTLHSCTVYGVVSAPQHPVTIEHPSVIPVEKPLVKFGFLVSRQMLMSIVL